MKPDLIELANQGTALEDALIIDGHTHMGPYYNFHIPYNDASGMLGSMDALGIDCSLVCPHLSIGPDFRAGNDLTVEAIAKYPKRFIGAIGINPNYPGSALPEIERLIEKPGMRAIKIHPSLHDYPADGEVYREVYQVAAEHGLPVTTHTWRGDKRCSPTAYADIAREYPDTSFVLIHSGGAMDGVQEAIDAAGKSENIYLDTSGSMTFHMVERLHEGLGSKRILYGSDNPFIDPAAQIGKILYASIPEEAKLDILGLNSKELLGV